ncbi:MAG TPA: serine/threonine-protein kinase [Candidatus Eisenbacteria bacterium]|nr:serine/threonine-protein kinase [Candidatus Eisenbacteria bacterium]
MKPAPNEKPRTSLRAALSPSPSSSSGTATRHGTRGLPTEILQQSCKRLGIMAVIFASVWMISIVMNNFVHDLLHHMKMDMMGINAVWPMPGNLVAGIGIGISAIVFLIAWKHPLKPETLLRIGLVYEVATAALVSGLFNWKPVIGTSGVSWLCVIILVYPSIVPSTPRSTAIASFLAASMDPLFLLLAAARGENFNRDPFLLIWHFMPTYISVALATIPSKLIANLGRQVRKARELGAYQLGEMIGRGGMGEVYRARHRFLARPAAIKLIRSEALGGNRGAELTIQRFRREAQAAASLRSPHTISLYDFGVTDDGVFYYVMELLDGVDLETLVRRFGPVSAPRTIYLIRHVCHSLGEAHARGMVHRDIKPSNIHTCRLGLNVDFVKVLDFGLVKTNLATSQDQTLLTSPDVTTGTPAFMAPEMALGEVEVDSRADIYALGCVAYWLLTGRLVFEAESAVKMMLQHIQSDPVPPSQLTEIDVPPELDAIILACLSKKPEDRPASTLELAHRLEAIAVRETWNADRAEEWWERHLPASAPMTPLHQETPLATVHVAREEETREETR